MFFITIIYYLFLIAFLESKKRQIIEALDHYHQHTCLRFKMRTFEQDYVRFIYDEGCYSSIGRIGGRQTISLADGCYCKGTIIHEVDFSQLFAMCDVINCVLKQVMHALGFWHEQNRSDRDNYIEVLYQNIRPEAKDQFTKMSDKQNRLFTEYDYSSIMHYPGNAFAKSVDLITMQPKQPGVILRHACQTNALSERDIEKICKLYKCAV